MGKMKVIKTSKWCHNAKENVLKPILIETVGAENALEPFHG